MASIDDAIFLMDDEAIYDSIKKPIKHSNNKKEREISKSLPNETISVVNMAKSPPIDIIKPEKKKIKKKEEFVPCSPYGIIKCQSLDTL